MARGVGRVVRTTLGRLCGAGLLALGCSDLLGIHDPIPRPPDAEAGDAGDHASNPPRAGSSAGGAAGEPDAGGAGDAGHAPAAGGRAAGGEAGATGGDAPAGGGGNSGGIGGGGTSGGVGGGGTSGGVGGGTSGGGTGGSPPTPACTFGGPLRCDPASPKTPQVCSSAGEWVQNPAQNNGLDCAIACNAGVCGECVNGDASCKDNYARTCVSGTWVKPLNSCSDACVKGACVSAASCAGVVAPGSCNQESCCLSLEVTGNTFFRDGKTAFPATVSSFTMDKYEVTVARLKKYIDWYFGPEGSAPLPGAGKSAHFAADPGWVASYSLPARTPQGVQDMQDMLSCVTTHGDPVATNATFFGPGPLAPANCVSFYVAYAMCIWDGGRLPTEAEWDFSATSVEQRVYPWSVPASSTSIDATYAVYATTAPKDVGTLSAGHGLFGQLDLAGNVNEWTLDYFANPYPAALTPCTDCINTAINSARSVRGGSFMSAAPTVKTTFRTSLSLDSVSVNVGFRCVHDL